MHIAYVTGLSAGQVTARYGVSRRWCGYGKTGKGAGLSSLETRGPASVEQVVYPIDQFACSLPRIGRELMGGLDWSRTSWIGQGLDRRRSHASLLTMLRATKDVKPRSTIELLGFFQNSLSNRYAHQLEAFP